MLRDMESGRCDIRREILREVAVLSWSTMPMGMFSICPLPKIVAMKNRQNRGRMRHTRGKDGVRSYGSIRGEILYSLYDI